MLLMLFWMLQLLFLFQLQIGAAFVIFEVAAVDVVVSNAAVTDVAALVMCDAAIAIAATIVLDFLTAVVVVAVSVIVVVVVSTTTYSSNLFS